MGPPNHNWRKYKRGPIKRSRSIGFWIGLIIMITSVTYLLGFLLWLVGGR